jgi:integrase
MTNSVHSTNPQTLSKASSLAEVAAFIAADKALSPRKTRDIRWGFSKVATALGQNPETCPANPKMIGEGLVGFVPAKIGLGTGAFQNAVNLTRFGLRHAGIMRTPARKLKRFAPIWTEAMKLLSDQKHMMGMSRFARFCSEHEIAPEDVDDATFAKFLIWLGDEICPKARKTHRRATQIWNELAKTVRFWPTQLVTVPTYSKRYAVAWDHFPKGFQADVEAHIQHLAGASAESFLDCRPLKPSSLKTRRHQIQILATAAVQNGVAIECLTSLSALVVPEVVLAGLRFLKGRGKPESTAQVHDIARAAASIAKHWAKAPPETVEKLTAWARKLERKDSRITPSNEARLREFDDPKTLNAFFKLPMQLVREAAACEGAPGAAEARKVQTALILEMLINLPMRRHNLAALNLDLHFSWRSDGSVLLHIPAAEVKNAVPIEAVLSRECTALLSLYLKKYHKLLTEKPSRWLFPGRGKTHKTREAIASQFTKTVKQRIGIDAHMHLMRHFAAKMFLEADPGNYGVVQRLLGHKSPATTLAIYAGLEARAAVTYYDKKVRDVRDKLSQGNTKGGKGKRDA